MEHKEYIIVKFNFQTIGRKCFIKNFNTAEVESYEETDLVKYHKINYYCVHRLPMLL
jgi:hypothetical protein